MWKLVNNLCLLRTKYEVEFRGDGRILSTKFDIDINAGMSVDMSQVLGNSSFFPYQWIWNFCKFLVFMVWFWSLSSLTQIWAGTLVKNLDGGYTLNKIEANASVLKTNLVSNTAMRGNIELKIIG